MYSSYEDVTAYRNDKCTPDGITNNGRDEVTCPLQSALQHQINRIFSDDYGEPEIKFQAITLSGLGYTIVFYFKYGADGMLQKCIGMYPNVSECIQNLSENIRNISE